MSDLPGRRILVVEDDYLVAADLAGALSDAGFAVVGPIGTVSEALRQVSEGDRLDGAVLDINLHGQKVFAVAETLRLRQVPFLFATGYSDSAIPPEFASAPRCEKPVQLRAVIQLLARQIA